MPNTSDIKKELLRWKVRPFAQDFRLFTPEQLRQEFAASSSGRVLLQPLIRNVIYQAATWIQEGKAPKVEGNLRSLYYQWLKPILARLPEANEARTDPYQELLNAMELFVVKLGLFRYRDLELVDERWENRWFTDGRNPHLLVFAEKNGFVMFLQEQSLKYGLTAVALGGSPSHLSSEYLCEQLRKRIGKVEPLVLFGIADFDPSGFDIARTFREQLEHQGLKILETHALITPKSYSPQELTLFQFPVPSTYKVRVSRWLQEGGGIEGKAVGLEADSLPKTRLRQRLAELITPYLREPKALPA